MLERRKFVSRYAQITGDECQNRWQLDYGETPQPTEPPEIIHLHGTIRCGAAAIHRDPWAEHELIHRALDQKRRRRDTLPMVMPKWVKDFLKWCHAHGIKTDDDIAAWIGVTRQTVWGWKNDQHPQPENIKKIIEKTNGEIVPRRRRS